MTELSEQFNPLKEQTTVSLVDLLRYASIELDRYQPDTHPATEVLPPHLNEVLIVLGLFLTAGQPRPTEEEGDKLISNVWSRIAEWKSQQ